MTLRFIKMHGLGNDFMVVEAQTDERLPNTSTWRKLADRHTGIGFDQALVIFPSRQPGAVAFYKIFNADGGEVEQCGNGARCVAEWLRVSGRVPTEVVEKGFSLDSPGGRIEARFGKPGMVSVNMGIPNFLTEDTTTLSVAGQRVTFTEVSMGNPHIVLRVDDVDVAPVAVLGPILESHPRFPNRTNVGFLQVVDRAHARLRVFERGVGETLACGTGACAAVAAGRRSGWFEDEVEVLLPGGSLQISWLGEKTALWMTGPAEIAYRGEIDIL
jgi:diaminopimelate epimerase